MKNLYSLFRKAFKIVINKLDMVNEETLTKMNILLGRKGIKNIKGWKTIKPSTKVTIFELKTPKDFLELRITSGSTGNPLYIFYSKEAINAFIRRTRESIKKSGVSKKDIVLNLFAYGNYIPGSMYERACLLEEIPILPLGAPNTYPKEKIIEVILKIEPTVWFSVPSYAIGLLEVLKSIDHKMKPRKVIVAGEMLLDSYLAKFEELGVEVVNHFGLTECPAIGVSKKGRPKVIEVIEDGVYIEAININENLQLLVTDLNNTSTPIIRYNTQDILQDVRYNNNESLKEFTIVGRSDDLVKLQGMLTSKTKIDDFLSKYTERFIVYLETKDNRDHVRIIIPSNLKEKEKEILDGLSFIFAKKSLMYEDKIDVPKTSSYKLRHIVDLRR